MKNRLLQAQKLKSEKLSFESKINIPLFVSSVNKNEEMNQRTKVLGNPRPLDSLVSFTTRKSPQESLMNTKHKQQKLNQSRSKQINRKTDAHITRVGRVHK